MANQTVGLAVVVANPPQNPHACGTSCVLLVPTRNSGVMKNGRCRCLPTVGSTDHLKRQGLRQGIRWLVRELMDSDTREEARSSD